MNFGRGTLEWTKDNKFIVLIKQIKKSIKAHFPTLRGVIWPLSGPRCEEWFRWRHTWLEQSYWDFIPINNFKKFDKGTFPQTKGCSMTMMRS